MSPFIDKLLHFAIGLAVGTLFWWLLERYSRAAARTINPITFLIMLVWGASGLFFFRKLGIPFFSHTFFYMAIADWDIPLYKATGLKFLIHRSWLFHSVIIPVGLLSVWIGLSRQPLKTSLQRWFNSLLRDCAMGLAVGISAHLLWDAMLSSTRRGFYIHGFSSSLSWLWLLGNLAIGLGLPLIIARQFQSLEPPVRAQ
ncbi:MAG: hypothetical protein AAF722_21520 [Cyanobacteria bacterium P01_C01_bin.70]